MGEEGGGGCRLPPPGTLSYVACPSWAAAGASPRRIVWWLVFDEPLGARKWAALVLLCVGTVLAGWPSRGEGAPDQKAMYIDTTGAPPSAPAF